jgi:hypothetical protein
MMLDFHRPSQEETIPIIKGVTLKEVPMAMFRPLEADVFRNFGRTLKRIADHRGLTAKEALSLLQGQPVVCGTESQNTVAEKVLADLIKEWRRRMYDTGAAEALEEEKEEPVTPPSAKKLFRTDMRVDFPEIIEAIDRPGFAWSNLNAAEQDNLLDSLTTLVNKKITQGYDMIVSTLGKQFVDPVQKTQDLFDAIKHGDLDHQVWLSTAIHAHFTGQPMPDYVAGKRRNHKNGGGRDRRLVLLGWRMDWPADKRAANKEELQASFITVDEWATKDYNVSMGAVAVELFGDQEHAPAHGPHPWPHFESEYRHEEGEPFFVLLGRDPQAPELVERWANIREIAEPGDWKINSSRNIAQAMRTFKGIFPDIGMSVDQYESALTSLHRSERDE